MNMSKPDDYDMMNNLCDRLNQVVVTGRQPMILDSITAKANPKKPWMGTG